MKGNEFKHLPNMATLVRKYQNRWHFCLGRKTRSYYWLGSSA
jgi:hypothetical protein